jgi:dihydrofolate synthase/folylpolyglutamate synthase
MTNWSTEAELSKVYQQINARQPEYEFKPGLERIRAAAELLGHPESLYQVIHVAGTNGKTSTCRIAEALLRSRGLRTGLLTSPPLTDPRDRIAIDGERISAERFIDSFSEIQPVVQLVDAASLEDNGHPMGLFEVYVLLGLAAFADAPVDVAVIETGMGGSWDATNIVDSQVQVITPISFDHQRWLGDDLESIASEKAGILKSAAVIARQRPQVLAQLQAALAERGGRAYLEDEAFGVIATEEASGGQTAMLYGLLGNYGPLFLPLLGEHQAHNAALALAAVELLFGAGGDGIQPEFETVGPAPATETALVAEGLASVKVPGRLEVLRLSPLVMVDAAHNVAGAQVLAEALDQGTFPRMVGLVGVLADKDAEGILGALEPVLVSVVITQSSSDRALDAQRLAAVAEEVFGPDRVTVVDALDQALATAIELADEDTAGAPAVHATGVVATGSVTIAGQVSALLKSLGDDAATAGANDAVR